MATRTWTKAIAAVTAGVLLLTACGGGGETRSRNAALGTLEQADCWLNQATKDEAVVGLQAAVDEARASQDAVEGLLSDTRRRQEIALMKWVELDNFVASFDGSVPDDAQPQYIALQEEHAALLEASRESDATYESTVALASTLAIREFDLNDALNKPVCGEGSEQDAASSPDSSTDTEDGETASESTDDEAQDPSTVTESSGESTDTTIDTSTTETTPTITESSDDVTQTTTSTGDIAAASAPCIAMPRGGTSYVVNVGESVKLDFDLCDGANWLRLRGPKGHRKTFGVTRVNSSTLTVVGKAVGTTWVNVRQANRDIKPMQLLSKPTRIEIVVRDPEVSDPCAGKVPLGEWTDDADGGVLTAASTCEGQPLVFVIFRKKDEQLQYAMRFFSQEGQPTSGLGKLYGPGDYEVTMSHGYVEKTPDDSRSVLLGERLTLEVNHQGAPETEGTISNGAITTERQGVVSMPPAVFSSVVDEGPEDPRNTGAAVPVAALPEDATVMSCDASCLEGVVSRAGLETGAVEISIGDGEWTKVTARSSFVVPFEPTSVKMRVTPEEGQPVEMAAVFTRESVDAVYSAAENDSEEVEITDAVVGADGSTSFPWWIIAVIVALLAAGYAERRRRASKAASAS